jgi:ATP-dependent DNA ligase
MFRPASIYLSDPALGHNFADRFPIAAAAIEALPVRSCVVDGEAIVCDDDGMAVFNLIRGHATNARAILCAFDLLEVNGEDLRREPIENRKRRLTGLLRLQHDGIALNEASRATAPSSTSTPARSAARASFRSGWVHRTGPGDRLIGSR